MMVRSGKSEQAQLLDRDAKSVNYRICGSKTQSRENTEVARKLGKISIMRLRDAKSVFLQMRFCGSKTQKPQNRKMRFAAIRRKIENFRVCNS